MNNETKKTIYIHASQTDWEAWIELLNKFGSSPHAIFPDMLYSFIKALDEAETTVFLRVWTAGRGAQRQQILMDQLKAVGYQYSANKTNEGLDALMDLCEAAGVDVKDVIDEASKNEQVLEYIKIHGTMGKVEQFLVDNMPVDTGVAATTILTKATEALGCSQETVNRAKRKLGIESKRVKGGQWIWYWPEKMDSDLEEEITELMED